MPWNWFLFDKLSLPWPNNLKFGNIMLFWNRVYGFRIVGVYPPVGVACALVLISVIDVGIVFNFSTYMRIAFKFSTYMDIDFNLSTYIKVDFHCSRSTYICIDLNFSTYMGANFNFSTYLVVDYNFSTYIMYGEKGGGVDIQTGAGAVLMLVCCFSFQYLLNGYWL